MEPFTGSLMVFNAEIVYNRVLLGRTWGTVDHESAMHPCDNSGKQHPGQQKGDHF